jgi:hypothetical protein
MAISEIVTDESLLPVLQTSAETLVQCQQLLSILNPDTLPNDSAKLQELSLAASKQQKVLFALLARLRGQNRGAIFRVRDTKQATAEARQEIDRLHLQLQNLYYEQKHLTGEIAACEAYEYVDRTCYWPFDFRFCSELTYSGAIVINTCPSL